MTPRRPDWFASLRRGTAETLHGPWPPPHECSARAVAACRVAGRPAVVLGSTQRRDVVDDERCAAAGVDVVSRHSGGGAVLVAPGAQVWMDVWIPRGDALWSDDVIEAASWLGHTWVDALASMGVEDGRVHVAGVVRSPWSDVVCFAGVGPGEVLRSNTKVVGVAQRRTNIGARFHTMALLSWEPDALVRLLALDEDVAARATVEMSGAAVGLGALFASRPDGGSPALIESVEEAFLRALP